MGVIYLCALGKWDMTLDITSREEKSTAKECSDPKNNLRQSVLCGKRIRKSL